MSTKEKKKKEIKKTGSGQPSFLQGLGVGLGKLWLFFILVIVLCINVCYLISIRICPPSYYFERVYAVSGADSLAASFSETMDAGGLKAELLNRITPNEGTLPAEITLQSEENSDLLTIRVSADNYYNAKNIMELFCVVYPEYAESAAEELSAEPVSEESSGADIIFLFLIRTAAAGVLSGLAVCVIWLFCYAAGYRKTDADFDGQTDADADPGMPAQPAAPAQPAKKPGSMKCLLELPKITLWEGKNSAAQKMLITSRYADEDFKTRISAFGRSVKKRMDNRESRILLVTSSVAGEGKSVAAANLALSLTEAGGNVALLETNFGDTDYPLTVEGPGLLDYVGGRVELEDILCLAGKNLVLVTPGSADGEQDYAALMGSDKIRDLLAVLADNLDYVIVDGAPLLGAPETVVLLEEADAILYVTRADQEDQAALRAGLKILAGAGSRVLGFVMNYSRREADDE